MRIYWSREGIGFFSKDPKYRFSRVKDDLLTKESFEQTEQDIEGLIAKQKEEDAAERKQLVDGTLTVKQYQRNKNNREKQLKDARERQEIFESQTLNKLTVRANRLEEAGLMDEANQVRGQIPKPDGDGIPKKDDGIPKKDDAEMQAGIDNIIKGLEEEQKQLSQQSGTDSDVQVTQVTQEDVKDAPSKLTTDTKKLVDESMSQANFPRMMIDDDGEFSGDNQNTIEGKEPGFFKSIWNAIIFETSLRHMGGDRLSNNVSAHMSDDWRYIAIF